MTERRWTLEDFCLPHAQLASRTPPELTNLIELVEEFHEHWVDPGVQLEDMMAFACERYGLGQDFTYPEFEKAAALRKFQYKQLLHFATEAGMFETDVDTIDKMWSIQRTMSAAAPFCMQAVYFYNTMEGSRNHQVPPMVVEDDTFEEHDPTKLTSFQNLLIRILKRIFIKQFRKSGDGCYEEITSTDGHPTHAYRFVCTIEEEVWSVQKEVSFELWKFFTNPRDNPRAVVDHLIKSSQAEFPILDVGQGHWFSFDDGLYNVRHDLFFYYDQDPVQYAKAMQEARTHPHSYPTPNQNTVAINYFPIKFRDPPTPENVSVDPFSISTPGFEKIFDTQQFDDDTKRWAYLMIGRLFFQCNTLDRWQRVIFLIGGGGTGKTTIAQWLQYVFNKFYSLINSNFEEQFGLGPLCNDRFRICMCTEMGEDIKFKQEEFQICAEGGEQQAAKKGIDSFPYMWKQHMIFCGNQFPRRWKNNGKQISRRAFLLHYKNLVRKSAIDTRMNEQLQADSDRLIRKCTSLYVAMALEHGHEDIEAPGLMPDQVREFMKAFESAIDPLTSFLDCGRFIFDPSFFMPLDEFKREYFEFRKSNGHSTIGWTKDHYQSTFQSWELSTVRRTLEYCGNKRCTDWVVGLVIQTDEEVAEGMQDE